MNEAQCLQKGAYTHAVYLSNYLNTALFLCSSHRNVYVGYIQELAQGIKRKVLANLDIQDSHSNNPNFWIFKLHLKLEIVYFCWQLIL